jgi:hypothetical protein
VHNGQFFQNGEPRELPKVFRFESRMRDAYRTCSIEQPRVVGTQERNEEAWGGLTNLDNPPN